MHQRAGASLCCPARERLEFTSPKLAILLHLQDCPCTSAAGASLCFPARERWENIAYKREPRRGGTKTGSDPLRHRLPSFNLLVPQRATTSRILIPAFLFVRLRDHRWRLVPIAMFIHRNERQIGRSHMTRGAGNVILCPAFHANLK
jgi:hypothetical protein